MILLAIETSCDETSAAVVGDGTVLATVISSQIALHAEYGGVVPELAAREHLRNLPIAVRQSLAEAQVEPGQLNGIAATQGPGLPTALLAGLKTAQTMAYVLGCPFVGVHHHEAHLYSPWIQGSPARASFERFEPNISLIVSGGHTLLVHVKGEFDHEILGGTIDDAAGECFDKTGKLLGLPYPAGPVMDRLAAKGNPRAFDFPRPLLKDPGHDFSFSGLKTSVRYYLRDHPELLEADRLADVCASVQAAIVEVLTTKTVRAAKRCGVRCVTASGGVTCNSSLRANLAKACARDGLRLQIAMPGLCTDNAAMIGIVAERRLMKAALSTDLDADIRPNWPLAETGSGIKSELR